MSTPPKIGVTTGTTHFVNISFGESEERIKPTYKKGLFRPTRLQIAWEWNHDTQGWRLSNVLVAGPMVKKDGSDGENRGDRRFVDYGGRGKLVDGTPDWVIYLIDEQTPTVVGR